MIDVNILAVDDNSSDLLLFEESIEEIQESLKEKDILINFHIITATDGTEAVELIKETQYDVVFLDIKMPKMDGHEVLSKIRETDTKTYVVMFTTSDYNEDVKKSKENGANGYLLKSLDIKEFEENLKSIILIFLHDNFVYIDITKPKYKNLS